jgi:hypothetical protein
VHIIILNWPARSACSSFKHHRYHVTKACYFCYLLLMQAMMEPKVSWSSQRVTVTTSHGVPPDKMPFCCVIVVPHTMALALMRLRLFMALATYRMTGAE